MADDETSYRPGLNSESKAVLFTAGFGSEKIRNAIAQQSEMLGSLEVNRMRFGRSCARKGFTKLQILHQPGEFREGAVSPNIGQLSMETLGTINPIPLA